MPNSFVFIPGIFSQFLFYLSLLLIRHCISFQFVALFVMNCHLMWHFQGQDGISPGLEHLSAVVFQVNQSLNQPMNFTVKDCDGVGWKN